MDVLEAIQTRHSLGKVKPDAVSREIVEKLLSAAVQAPSHYNVRPWRFVVLTGDGRKRLGDVLAEVPQLFREGGRTALRQEGRLLRAVVRLERPEP